MKTKLVLVICLTLLSFVYGVAQDLKKHEAQDLKSEQGAKEVYSCPMHPEVVSDRPGKCPKCGMKLEKQVLKGEKSPVSMMGKPTFEKSVDGVRLQLWLITQEDHKKMMQEHMGEKKDKGEMKGMNHDAKDGKEMMGMKHDGKEMSMETMDAMIAGTHHVMLMATDEATKKEIENVKGEITLTSPSNKMSTVELTSMKNHFGGGLTLDEKGAYTLDVWVSSKQKTRTASFKYEVN